MKKYSVKTAIHAVEPSISWRHHDVFADHWSIGLILPTSCCIVITHQCISLLRIEVQLPQCIKVVNTVVIPFPPWSASVAALLQTAMVHR